MDKKTYDALYNIIETVKQLEEYKHAQMAIPDGEQLSVAVGTVEAWMQEVEKEIEADDSAHEHTVTKEHGVCDTCGFNTLGLTNKELKNHGLSL